MAAVLLFCLKKKNRKMKSYNGTSKKPGREKRRHFNLRMASVAMLLTKKILEWECEIVKT
jgi:hypothetical protein